MTSNRQPIRPGQRYAECEECGVFARGGSRRLVLKHQPHCSKAQPAEPIEPDGDRPPADD